MIEKLEKHIIGENAPGMVSAMVAPTAEQQVDKINEIIALLNAIVVDVDGIKCIDGSKKAEQVDPYAEQKKWIGCLCRFWNFKDGAVDIGILKAVDNLKPTIPYINDIDCSYAFCEPVKPDSELIYHGE